MTKKFTLGTKEKLKSRKSIGQLFSEGKKITVSPYLVFYTLKPADGEPVLLFGAGVSAKNFKRAVDRNRIKRLAREAYRLQKIPLQEKLKEVKINMNVFFIYTSKEMPVYDEVYKKIRTILSKLEKIVTE